MATENRSIVPTWLEWAREIQALSQTGAHYSQNEFDRERYKRLAEISAEIIHEHTDHSTSDLVQLFDLQAGYATPRVDVRAVIFQEGKLLLVRERSDGGWTLPGGWADVGDLPSQAAEREVWEEAGFIVRAKRVIGVYDANRNGPLTLFHAYKLIFLCELLEGEARPSFETSEVAFFSQGDLPSKLSGERTRPRHIMDAFAILADPTHPVFFD